jgi:hypothetical protein
MKTISLFIIIYVLITLFGCSKNSLELNVDKNEPGIKLLEKRSVKLNKADEKNPAPAQEFNINLLDGTHYRFAINSSAEFDGQGVLKIYGPSGNFMATTYNEKKDKHYDEFDFMCKRGGNFKVLISFTKGKEGYAEWSLKEIVEFPQEIIFKEKIPFYSLSLFKYDDSTNLYTTKLLNETDNAKLNKLVNLTNMFPQAIVKLYSLNKPAVDKLYENPSPNLKWKYTPELYFQQAKVIKSYMIGKGIDEKRIEMETFDNSSDSTREVINGVYVQLENR